MLVSFTASNFLSFKDSVEFSTRATRERQHGHRVFVHDKSGNKLVTIAAILGANASGKSNFYRAVLFLRRLVLQLPQSADELIPVEPFKLDDGVSDGRPSRFVIELLPADTVYRLSIAVTRHGVVEEKLEEVGDHQTTVLYSRLKLRGNENWDIEELQDRTKVDADREFIAFKTRDTLANQLFLSVLRGKNLPVVDEVCSWFSDQLALMLPETSMRRLEFNLPMTGGLLEFCNETLRTAGTGVHDLHLEKVDWDDFPASSELKEELQKALGERQSTFVMGPDGRRFSVTRHHGELRAWRIQTNHRAASGKLVRFELKNESEGTQRFLDLLPAFFEMVRPGRPKVFIIDELDRSLHAQLARHLVKSYLQAMHSQARSQLIFTTHDVMLLDQELLRRDEIWFMEKDDTGASTMKPLAAINGIRYDRDIRRSYLDGMFGGVPRFTGPAFQRMSKPRTLAGDAEAAGTEKRSRAALGEYAMFERAFPANSADQMICALVLNFVELRESIRGQELLDALILATHPDICRPLSGTKPTRKIDALFDTIRTQLSTIERTGLRWHECLAYLEKKRAIVVARNEAGHPVSPGPEFSKSPEIGQVEYMPVALFTLSVVDWLKDNKPSRGPTAEKSFAARSFEVLRAKYVAT